MRIHDVGRTAAFELYSTLVLLLCYSIGSLPVIQILSLGETAPNPQTLQVLKFGQKKVMRGHVSVRT